MKLGSQEFDHTKKTAAKPCKPILGYDANALYLSTMLNDMQCGKEKVIDYEDLVLAAIELKNAITNGKLFGSMAVSTGSS